MCKHTVRLSVLIILFGRLNKALNDALAVGKSEIFTNIQGMFSRTWNVFSGISIRTWQFLY